MIKSGKHNDSSEQRFSLVRLARQHGHSRSLIAASLLLALLLSSFCTALNAAADSTGNSFAVDSFQQVWQRTDLPVVQGKASRSLMWGAAPFKAAYEGYQEAPDGERLVQYFDKARMEITNPNADPNSAYYVTNGLLVRELISGKMQTGDNRFETRQPANVPVAGDPLAANPNAPTYASFNKIASLNNDNRAANATNQKVTANLAKDGTIGNDASLAAYNVTNVYYSAELGHNIPDVFWNFMHSTGIVYNPTSGSYSNDTVVNWVMAMGLPISEAYWAKVKVGGVEKEVLMQAFERRVLTYTPSNPAAYQVEMGNVGLHYATWRYGYLNMLTVTSPTDGTTANIDRVTITGHVSQPDAVITVNDDNAVLPDSNGNFSTEVDNLQMGANDLAIAANTSNDQEVIFLTVTYQP